MSSHKLLLNALAKCSLTTLFVGLSFNKSALTYDMYPGVASNPDDLTMTCALPRKRKKNVGGEHAGGNYVAVQNKIRKTN